MQWLCNGYGVGLMTQGSLVCITAILVSGNNHRQVAYTRACVTYQYKLHQSNGDGALRLGR